MVKRFRFFFLLFLLVQSKNIFSQSNRNLQQNISSIEEYVQSVLYNTSLKRVELTVKDLSEKKISGYNSSQGTIHKIIAFYSGDTIKHIQVLEAGANMFGGSVDYFLDSEGVIFISGKYQNMSRMGSCGELEIENRLYYNAKKLIKSETIEKPFTCYNNEINEALLLSNLESLLNMLQEYSDSQK